MILLLKKNKKQKIASIITMKIKLIRFPRFWIIILISLLCFDFVKGATVAAFILNWQIKRCHEMQIHNSERSLCWFRNFRHLRLFPWTSLTSLWKLLESLIINRWSFSCCVNNHFSFTYLTPFETLSQTLRQLLLTIHWFNAFLCGALSS